MAGSDAILLAAVGDSGIAGPLPVKFYQKGGTLPLGRRLSPAFGVATRRSPD
jgi:hypothetical protein